MADNDNEKELEESGKNQEVDSNKAGQISYAQEIRNRMIKINQSRRENEEAKKLAETSENKENNKKISIGLDFNEIIKSSYKKDKPHTCIYCHHCKTEWNICTIDNKHKEDEDTCEYFKLRKKNIIGATIHHISKTGDYVKRPFE